VTEVVVIDRTRPDLLVLQQAANRLRGGELVAFPTETVYGLGANALDRSALRRVFEAKERPSSDPLILHVACIADVKPLVTEISDQALRLAWQFWPGPLTLVLPRSERVPREATAGLNTVAVRAPAHPVARTLMQCAGVPVTAPSANLFSRPSPTTAAHVLQDLDGRIDLLIDAGPTDLGIESTVIDLTTATAVILRPGAVTLEMIRQVLPQVETLAAPAGGLGPMPSPGMLEKHYAPRAPLTLYTGPNEQLVSRLATDASVARAIGDRVGVLAATEDLPVLPQESEGLQIVSLGSIHDPASVAAHLYAGLRALDAAGVDIILARAFPFEYGVGAAVADRLRRAAAGRIVTL
jgi:L-threonylcarbamoyladenylate synthase